MPSDDQATEQADHGDTAIVRRGDGAYFNAAATPAALLAAVNDTFLGSAYFSGLDYQVFIRVLYNCGSELPAAMRGQPLWRFADRVEPFEPVRRALYKSVRIINGEAEYYFEPVYFDAPGMPAQPAKLNFDEFVADMWIKGVRFGIDAAAVKEALVAGRAARVVVARRLPALPGRDATIAEVSRELHRSNAPRETGLGRFDLHTFQNRFPQVKPHIQLLRKVPPVPGQRGYELSGMPIEPAAPRDLELTRVAGEGTVIQHIDGVDYLVSAAEGFVSIDPATRRISIGSKIISREGVSARTTGNLQLTGEYEEFGEVQEQRTVEGGNITIHGDVFGKLSSRGGNIVLNRNLIGGTVTNADGDIRTKGVASGAVLQTKKGEITVARAESCIISGTRVVIGEASNCEIIADEVVIKLAQGCAIAARRMEIISAGPRKQAEMLLYPLVPDTSKYDRKIAELGGQLARHEREAAQRKQEIDSITSQPEMRKYLTLATRIRKRELVLTPEQEPLFEKMAIGVGPSLKEIARISLAMKAAQAQRDQVAAQIAVVEQQKQTVVRGSRCSVKMFSGDVLVRGMCYNPDTGAPYDLPPKELKARVRAAAAAGLQPIYAGASGALEWALEG
ncbi:flagellar assembly protein A [Oxalobacteraceae bacterium A2-2]